MLDKTVIVRSQDRSMVTMISAMTRKRVIGASNGGIPWHLPRDIAHFRACTDGKHMLLGRKTYEEMAGWFTTQVPLVLTSRSNYRPEPGTPVGKVDDAIAIARENSDGELLVSGGAQVYTTALPYADRLVLTVVDAAIDGPALFPDYEKQGTWATISEESFPADDDNAFAMTFLTLERCP